ncbi:hypothetical protein [Nocardioides yefusunii]|uniref:Uncharacterized protein n=1 Tax=Nocardioides yefusunii TaxID=2500546 RepID=A0ABW1QUY8_9ACTN|nr:hypothetical protein [Nocardioides yefusunii]
MKKLLVLAAVPALTLTLLTAPATAVPGKKVTGKNVPTASQIAGVFPALKGNRADVARVARLTLSISCQWGTLYRGAGLSAGYTTRKAQPQIPVVHVTESTSAKKANTAVARFGNEKKKCHRTGADPYRVTRISLPALGDQRAGYSVVTRNDAGGPLHVTVIAYRKKTRIIHATVLSDTKVSAARTKKLARLVYRTGVK